TAFVGSPSYQPLGLLQHARSLAIGEQVYIVWPVALALCLRKTLSATRILLILGGAALASAVWRAVVFLEPLGPHGAFGAYHRSDTRADGLALGCAVAGASSTAGRGSL